VASLAQPGATWWIKSLVKLTRLFYSSELVAVVDDAQPGATWWIKSLVNLTRLFYSSELVAVVDDAQPGSELVAIQIGYAGAAAPAFLFSWENITR
jgi:hypothetical protein